MQTLATKLGPRAVLALSALVTLIVSAAPRVDSVEGDPHRHQLGPRAVLALSAVTTLLVTAAPWVRWR